jgi:hypothetical protein
MKLYIVLFRYSIPGEKRPGPVRQFQVYATSYDEARSIALQQAKYPNIEVLSIKAT